MKEVKKLSKRSVQLTLVEMYAIKHALQKQVSEREAYLNGNGYTDDGRARAEKDQTQEKALIVRFENLINDFREKNQIK